MLRTARRRFRRLCCRQKCKIYLPSLAALFKKTKHVTKSAKKEPFNNPSQSSDHPPSIRLATFNVAMFSMAPAAGDTSEHEFRGKSANDRPRSILKQPPGLTKHKMRVSINLPDNEIERKGKDPGFGASKGERSRRSVLDVLREVDADIIGLQNVKAVEEKGMRPLSDLAAGLGMKYVFAESWAPEYGNAVLSRFPIKQWKVQKVFDDSDFRNVVKATIEVPRIGEVNFHCTHLDHLDERWRMKQIHSMLQSNNEGAHILVGGLNSLDPTDYSPQRWDDIVKYFKEIGKPEPKAEVMKFLKARHYVDAKNFAGECEAVVVLAKGQDVQGTCKYGTRVDYILTSPNSMYKFVPCSYEVISSKGTSDHHIVKVDIVIDRSLFERDAQSKQRKRRDVIKI